MRLAPLVLLAVLVAAPASAQTVYRYVDEAGDEHYTDDKASIPAKFRKSAKPTSGKDLGTVSASRSDDPPKDRRDDSEALDQPSKADVEKAKADEEARDEASWRERFRSGRETISRLEKSIAADRAVLANPNAAGIPLRFDQYGTILPNPVLDEIRARIARDANELEAAKEHFADLERDAARKAIPLEWRRPPR